MAWNGRSIQEKKDNKISHNYCNDWNFSSSSQQYSSIQQGTKSNNPLKVCINDRDTPYKIKATLELIVDGQKADIPANIGLNDGECQRTMYTLTNDGTIYAEWEEEYPFEIGHFCGCGIFL